MTLREEFENEVKTNKGGISLLFETSNQHYIEWLECKVKNLSSNTVLADSTPPQECYKSGEPCKYDCSGLCKESC